MNTANPDFIDDMMENLLELDGFIRMEYEEIFSRHLPPPETHRPLPPSEEQVKEKGEAYWTYPLRLEIYQEKCYDVFVKWNRKCLNELTNTELNHLAWVFSKFNDSSLKLMDEESGACFTAQNFFFDQDKKLVITNPR